jgi:hypothetical protein
MSFWKSLFGGRGAASDAAGAGAVQRREEYNGFTIEATPYPEGGQYQVAGTIRREIDGQLKEHKFVRADRFATLEDAVSVSMLKARQIVDQVGARMFEPR